MFHFIYIPDLAYSFPVFVPRISTKFTGNNMEVIRIPSRAFPWSVFICCEEALTLHSLCWLRWGFPRVSMNQPKGSGRACFRGVGKVETSS